MAVSRLHVGMSDDGRAAGGLNRALENIVRAQQAIGLDAARMTWPPEVRHDQVRVESGSDAHFAEVDSSTVVECHFAGTTRRARKALPARLDWISHFHGPWFREGIVEGDGWSKSAAKWAVEMSVYHQAPVVTCHSESFGRILSTQFAVPSRRIRHVPLGVDVCRFRPGDKGDARRRLGLPRDAWVVGSARRLVRRMGLADLVAAVALIPEVTLVIAGDGPERETLTRTAQELGIAHRCSFLGRIDDDLLTTFYQALDVFVVPSRALEGFGLVVLEALASGVPVLASEVGGLAEALGPWAATSTYPVGDIQALAERIRASSGVGEREEMRAYAESMTWEQTAHGIESAIELTRR